MKGCGTTEVRWIRDPPFLWSAMQGKIFDGDGAPAGSWMRRSKYPSMGGLTTGPRRQSHDSGPHYTLVIDLYKLVTHKLQTPAPLHWEHNSLRWQAIQLLPHIVTISKPFTTTPQRWAIPSSPYIIDFFRI